MQVVLCDNRKHDCQNARSGQTKARLYFNLRKSKERVYRSKSFIDIHVRSETMYILNLPNKDVTAVHGQSLDLNRKLT